MQWLIDGGPNAENKAAIELATGCSRPLRRDLQRYRLSDETTEEVVNDALFKFIRSPLPRDCPASVWLRTIARHAAISRIRSDRTRPELLKDSDFWLMVVDVGVAETRLPEWARLCVHRAAALMQQEDPRHAQILEYAAEGWSREQIAVYFRGTPGPVSEREKANARDRVFRAVQAAREYFSHCKE